MPTSTCMRGELTDVDQLPIDDRGAVVDPEEPGIAGVHRRVREAILSGQLEPGAIVSQVRLATELGVSRTPLREVLRMLQREGLVESEHNRRVRIAPFSLADLEEIYASRIVLESFATRLTVVELTVEELAEMRHCWHQMRDHAGNEDYECWQGPHARFHNLATCHAGARLERTLRLLSDHAERYRHTYTTQAPQAWSVGLVDHENVLRACEAHDVDGAARALAVHLGRTALSTIAMVSPTYDPVKVRAALRMVTEPTTG